MQGQIKMFKSFQDISGRVSYLPFSSWQIYEVPRKATWKHLSLITHDVLGPSLALNLFFFIIYFIFPLFALGF